MDLYIRFYTHGFLRQLINISCLLVLISAKGGRNNDDEIQIYEIDPRDPVIYTKKLSQPQVLYSGGAYANWDLQYYTMFYPRYEGFLGTEEHLANMERVTTSDGRVEVCLNHDITNGNFTLGAFTCPLPFEPNQFDHCCGLPDAEFCCSSKTAGRTAGIAAFLAITFSIIVFGILFYMFAGREIGKKRRIENHF